MKRIYFITSHSCIKCRLLARYLIDADVFFTEYTATSTIGRSLLDAHPEISELPVLMNASDESDFITGFNPVEIDKFLRRDA